MDIVTFTDARANLKAVMDKVAADKSPVIIHRRDAEDMVMVSKAEWDSLQETLHLLSSPRNAERLLGAIGRFMTAERNTAQRPATSTPAAHAGVSENAAPYDPEANQ